MDIFKEKVVFNLAINGVLSVFGYLLVKSLIPAMSSSFIKANLFGIDMSKTSKEKIPEAQGVVCGAVYLVLMFLFIPVLFYDRLRNTSTETFPFHEYVEYLAALLSVCCMIFLGFADDVLDLRWRHKLLLPTIASLPLLMVYFVTFDLTIIIVPGPLRPLLGESIDIGFLYYLYMGMLAVFCTNAINIVAGINGIEVSQGIIIGLSVIAFNLIELKGEFRDAHLFSLYFLMPYIGICTALLQFNWYPSRVFVGDTLCYFSGMLFAVVAILGHFSKTLLLFFIPQVFNFVFSVPQLFRFVPCPRHRLPRYDAATDTLSMSYTQYKTDSINFLGRLAVWLFSTFKLVDVRQVEKEDGQYTECSNMTIINLVLRWFGPLPERTVTVYLVVFQVMCSICALLIRYPLAQLFYDK